MFLLSSALTERDDGKGKWLSLCSVLNYHQNTWENFTLCYFYVHLNFKEIRYSLLALGMKEG